MCRAVTHSTTNNRIAIFCSLTVALLCLLAVQWISIYANRPALQMVFMLKTDHASTYRLYYDATQSFNDRQSVAQPVAAGNTIERLVFELPSWLQISRVKLSFGSASPARILLEDVFIEYGEIKLDVLPLFTRDGQYGLSAFDALPERVELTTDTANAFIYSSDMTRSFAQARQEFGKAGWFAFDRVLLRSAGIAAAAGGLAYVVLYAGRFAWLARLRRRGVPAATVAVFLLLLYVPFLFNLFWRTDSLFFVNENRILAQKPSAPGTDLGKFAKETESYFNDHFAMRNLFIWWDDYVRVQYLKLSPIPLIAVGKEGWLYYTSDRSMEDYKELVRFSDTELRAIRARLEERTRALRQQGIDFLLMIVPDKQTVYPEYLPDTIRKVGTSGGTRSDQLIRYLRETGADVRVLDTRPLLISRKAERILYYKADSHWNQYGAFLAYRELMKELAQRHSSLKVPLLDDYTITVEKLPNTTIAKDIPSLLGLASLFPDDFVRLKPKLPRQATEALVTSKLFPRQDVVLARETGNPALPRLVMFRDSFGTSLVPLLAESFDRSVFVWSNAFNMEIVQEERPDIVIYEVVERLLPELAK